MTRKKATFVLAASLFMPFQQSAHSATATTTLAVTAQVLSTCVVVAAPLAFGVYDPAANSDSTSIITVTCTNGLPYQVGLDGGQSGPAATEARNMTGLVSGDSLPYALYRDSARSLNWGNTPGTDTVAATAALVPSLHTVYGRIESGKYVSADNYSDLVNVTVTY